VTSAGPGLVIAGAARSGTSTLAAALREHPAIDPGATKEPNFFSRHYDRGWEWYESLYAERADGLLRMDASTSYTYPQFPDALGRLAKAAPDSFLVYVVREPIARAVSHYLMRRHTLRLEDAPTFGAALSASSYYTDVSDYKHWLAQLEKHSSPGKLLVVPFAALTASSHDVATVVCQRLELEPPPLNIETVVAHRNNVVEFRGTVALKAVKILRQSRVYPRIRAAVGATRVRDIRSRMIKSSPMPTVEEALATCSAYQRTELDELRGNIAQSVSTWLAEQDSRLGLTWSASWPTSSGPSDR